jgi:hypothetical protein
VEYGERKHLFVINPVSFKTEKDMDDLVSLIKDQFERIVKAEYEIRVSRFPGTP